MKKSEMLIFCPKEAAGHLLSEGVVAVPTETVYGLAGMGYSLKATKEIYRLKGRPLGNPLILHYLCLEDTEKDVIWTKQARLLAEAFWPGPLTLILDKHPHSQVPSQVSAGLNSLAVRVPAHPMIKEVLALISTPLAAPSANPSGCISPTESAHVLKNLSVPVLEGGPCAHGLESTIVDARREGVLRLLRPGALAREDIEKVARSGGWIFLDQKDSTISCPEGFLEHKQHLLQETFSENALNNQQNSLEKPFIALAPGQLSQHYAPKKPLRMNAREVLPQEGLMAFGPPLKGAAVTIQLSEKEDLQEAARMLFKAMHALDEDPRCASIAVMPIPSDGLGLAIGDRLGRAEHI